MKPAAPTLTSSSRMWARLGGAKSSVASVAPHSSRTDWSARPPSSSVASVPPNSDRGRAGPCAAAEPCSSPLSDSPPVEVRIATARLEPEHRAALLGVVPVQGRRALLVVAQLHAVEQRLVRAAYVHAAGAVLHLDALRQRVVQLPGDVERAPTMRSPCAARRERRQQRRRARRRSSSCLLGDATGRRAATTPVTGVGVCHAASSTGRLPLATRRWVPARERIAAPSPSVTAAHEAATAAARITVAASGAQTSMLASSHSTKKIAMPTTSVPKARPRSERSRPRQTALPISCATAKNPSVTRPAIAMAYATMAKGMSRMPMSVSASAMHSTTSPGRTSSCAASPTQKARANCRSTVSTTSREVGAGEQQHADGDDQEHRRSCRRRPSPRPACARRRCAARRPAATARQQGGESAHRAHLAVHASAVGEDASTHGERVAGDSAATVNGDVARRGSRQSPRPSRTRRPGPGRRWFP